MTSAPRLKHNPSHMSDAELIRDFVVRQHDLELVLERLRENRGASNQHMLILGPRGMGKTTLINRVIAEISRDPALRAEWYPIAFNEESYTVTSAAELWLQALVHLADQTRDRSLAATVEQLRKEGDDTRLRDRALARLMDFADAQDKRLLVVLENLDMLFEQQMSDDDGWDIRHTLQNEPRLMILATSTTRLDAFHDSDKALYELFWEHPLERLDLPEIQAVWRMVTGDELPLHRARPIQILTGGNTRLLVILASFARGRSFRELLTELVALIDEHTPYFKHNVESLPREERKLFVTLADLWRPASSRQVADTARTEVRKTSALLGRLAERGAIEEVRRIDHTRLYQVAERMYNLYHLLRSRNNERVRALVEFIVQFYDRAQLFDLIPSIAGEACTSECDGRDDIVHAVLGLLQQLPNPDDRRSILDRTPPEFRALPAAAEFIHEMLRSSEPLPPETDEQTLRSRTEADPDDLEAWRRLGDLLHARGDRAGAKRCYLEGWQRNRGESLWLLLLWNCEDLRDEPMSRVQEWRALALRTEPPAKNLARAMVALALAQASLEDEARREAADSLEEASHDAYVAAWCALVYLKLKDRPTAIEAMKHSLDLAPFDLAVLCTLPQVLVLEGRVDEAIDVLRSGIGRYPADESLRFMLLNVLLEHVGDVEAARLALENAHAAIPKSVEIASQLAYLLMRANEFARARALYEHIMATAPSTQVNLNLIHCYLSEGELERAEQAIQYWNPDVPSADRLAALAEILIARGDFRGATELTRQARELDPDQPDLLSVLVALLIVTRDVPAARAAAEAWIARHPGGEGRHFCARLVADRKLHPLLDDALGWAHDAAAALPLASGARITLARLLVAKGRFGDALTSVAALLDDSPVVRKRLGELTAIFIEISAVGETRDVLATIESSKSAGVLEALIVALRRMEGLEVNPPKEVSEVAIDIQRQIEKLRTRPGEVTAAVESRSETSAPAPPQPPRTRRRRPKPA